MKRFSPDRRKFLKLSATVAGSSLVLGINWSCSSEGRLDEGAQTEGFRPNAWLRLDPDGGVVVSVAEAEKWLAPNLGYDPAAAA